MKRFIQAAIVGLLLVGPASGSSDTNWFKILKLTTNNVVFVDANLAGQLTAASNHLFASRVGDAEFRRWDAGGLSNAIAPPSGYILVADLRTEKVYAFGDISGPLVEAGDATTLYEIDPVAAETNGSVIALSQSVTVSSSCSPEFGVFCGWGRVVVGRNPLFEITLPDGVVTSLGVSNPFNQFCDPSEPLTGVAEFFSNETYLVACQRFSGDKFERVRLADGTRTTLANFSGMPRNTKLTFSPSRNRWYFSTENSWLESPGSIIGYADATWDQTDVLPPPPPMTVTLPGLVILDEDTSQDISGSCVQRENAGDTLIQIVSSSNPTLLPTNRVTFSGSGFLFGESSTFNVTIEPMPEQSGTAVLEFLTTNSVGEQVSNVVTVQVASVNDIPGVSFNFPFTFTNTGASVTGVVTISDNESSAAVLGVSVESLNPQVIRPEGIVLSGTGSNRTVTITAVPGQAGLVSLRYRAIDPQGGENALVFPVQVVLPGRVQRRVFFNTDLTVAALAGLRGTSSATVTVAGVTGPVTRALLYWHGPVTFDNSYIQFNGQFLFGAVVAEADDNCWGFNKSTTHRAEVTSIVTGNGSYAISDYQESGAAKREANGVSLLVFHDDGDSANNRDVVVYGVNDSSVVSSFDAGNWDSTLNGLSYTGGSATLALHISDGQPGTNAIDPEVRGNGQVILSSGQTILGNTVPLRGGSSTNLAMWDLLEFDAAPLLTGGSNALRITSAPDTNSLADCVALVLVTVALPAGSVTPETDIGLQASQPAFTVLAGSAHTITVTATNNGPFATSITITNVLPAGAVLLSTTASAGAVATNSFAEIVWSLPGFAVGASATLNIVLQPEQSGFNGFYALAATEMTDAVQTNDGVYLEFTVLGGYPPPPTFSLLNASGAGLEMLWSPPSVGYVLQEADSLRGGIWSNSPGGGAIPGLVVATNATMFYRLVRP